MSDRPSRARDWNGYTPRPAILDNALRLYDVLADANRDGLATPMTATAHSDLAEVLLSFASLPELTEWALKMDAQIDHDHLSADTTVLRANGTYSGHRVRATACLRASEVAA